MRSGQRFIPYHVCVYLGKAKITLFKVALFSKFPCHAYEKGYYQQMEEMVNGKEVSLDNWARINAGNNGGNDLNLRNCMRGIHGFLYFQL